MAGKQRISGGFPFPVYVNETRSKQAIGPGSYVNEKVSGGTVTNLNLVASSACVGLMRRGTGKVLTCSNAGVALVVRGTSKALLASSACVASLTVLKVFLVQVLAQSACVGLVRRSTGKILTCSNAGAALMTRQTGKVLRASSACVASCVALKVFLVALLASSAAVALRRLGVGKVVTANSAAVALRGSMPIGKRLTASSPAVASMTRRTNKAFLASCAAVASLSASAGSRVVNVVASSAAVASLTILRVKYILAESRAVSWCLRHITRLLFGGPPAGVTLSGESRGRADLTGGSSQIRLTGDDK